ncbi:PREDICTED: glycerol kinase [Drosophila arizonae]|uniref:glycerol kinase n=1 Tax=Drosophila arizonae TaxID=7263 RepID=A0ABM1P5E1_DROAR|nr:PREDICTED: glycerol kinase [Drosophila arizonae]
METGNESADVNMSGPFIGAIDEGTTSARFMIFRAGTDDIVCYHQIEVPSIFVKEGWCEQDPRVITNTVSECIEGACKKLVALGGKVKDILAIGITNQRESTLIWDKNTGEALANAIIWLDNRTTSTVEDLLETIPNNARNINYLRPLCGLPLSPYFSGVKLRWLRDNVATVKRAMDAGDAMFGTIDTWLMYNLTGGVNGGVHKTDVTNASRTMLMNIETLQWDGNLLKFFGLPRSILPEICSSAEHFGVIAAGSLKGIPITADLGDQQAALVGQQCLSKGQAKATYGTGCFLLYNTGPSIVHSQHGLLTTVGYQLGRKASPYYALEGSVSIAGAAFNWLRDNIGLIQNTGQIETMASMVDNSLDVYFVPAFNGLYAPYWNQDARGVLCGLSEETTSEHIVRATLEAVCFQVRDILDSMHKDCKIPLAKLMVDGGMTVNNLFLQLQSDLVGIHVLRAKIAETTALGAAMAAYKTIAPQYNMEGPLSKSDERDVVKPKINSTERNLRYQKWKMAIERSLNWETSSLAQGERESFDGV